MMDFSHAVKTKPKDIHEWMKEGRDTGASFLVIVKDTLLAGTRYPIFVYPGQDLSEIQSTYSKEGQEVVKTYDLQVQTICH